LCRDRFRCNRSRRDCADQQEGTPDGLAHIGSPS
jgi:hypothetical protein